jgi:selenocysteine lyase/cysteine desulfurase
MAGIQPLAADWAVFRSQMPVTAECAYFDHAAVAPLPEPARRAVVAWADDTARHGDMHWKQWSERADSVRGRAAALLGAEPAEVALVRNTTEGINLVAEGFPWQPGDNVVVPEDEFPSNLFPWLNLASRGVETRRVACRDGRLDLDELAAACDERTRLISASWIGYATGWRNDVDALVEIAHQRGAYLFLDAIQGLGVFPLDVRDTPIDFLAADGHKWLLGPEGAGVLYVRGEHLPLLRPLGLGWNSVVHAGDFSRTDLQLKPTAARYEGGTCPMPGMVGLAASLELLAQYDVQAIAARLIELTDLACQRLTDIGATIASDRTPAHRSGIVAFTLPGRDPMATRKRCLENNVVLSCRGGRLRISPHAYNNEQDIERLIEAIQAVSP